MLPTFKQITLYAPSGALLDENLLDQAVANLQTYGLPVQELIQTRFRFQRFAGTDAQRIEGLETAMMEKEPSLLMATRGGYGLSRLLPKLNLQALSAHLNEKRHVLCGHSDITTLQLALLQQGVQPACLLHGPMACFDFGDPQGPNPITRHHFDQAWQNGKVCVEWPSPKPAISFNTTIAGPVWGGNLSMLCSLIGTPWLPQIQKGLLILEDINEPVYKIERMLLQLSQAGILGQQNAILMGQFGEFKLTGHDHGYDFESMIDMLGQNISIPIVTGFPFGHCHPKCAWFQGAHGELTFTQSLESTSVWCLKQSI